MSKNKDLWEIEVGDKLEFDGIIHTITDTSHVVKPDPFVIGKAENDGEYYEIRGNIHMDTVFKTF